MDLRPPACLALSLQPPVKATRLSFLREVDGSVLCSQLWGFKSRGMTETLPCGVHQEQQLGELVDWLWLERLLLRLLWESVGLMKINAAAAEIIWVAKCVTVASVGDVGDNMSAKVLVRILRVTMWLKCTPLVGGSRANFFFFLPYSAKNALKMCHNC